MIKWFRGTGFKKYKAVVYLRGKKVKKIPFDSII